jgi:hypothetical protein
MRGVAGAGGGGLACCQVVGRHEVGTFLEDGADLTG